MNLCLRSKSLALLIGAVFIGGIFLSWHMGWWNTASRRVSRNLRTVEYVGKEGLRDVGEQDPLRQGMWVQTLDRDKTVATNPELENPQGFRSGSPGKIESPGNSGRGAGGGRMSGTTNPQPIRGRTTFKEVLSWGVTKEQIEKIIRKPMPPEDTVIKDWCTAQGVEFSVIRDALQRLKPKN